MRLLPLLALAALSPAALAGQARYTAAFGVTAGTSLLHDRIFQDIEVNQALAPTFTLGASLPVSERERAGVELALGFGKSRIKEAGFGETDGPSFKTLSLTGGVTGPMLGPLRYRIGAGLIKYLADDEGFFRDGGPLLLLLSAGADYEYPLKGRLALVGRLRYDYQRFATDELQLAGFSRTQDIHRLGVGLGVEYRP